MFLRRSSSPAAPLLCRRRLALVLPSFIENQVKAILDAPVGAHGTGQFDGSQVARADVMAPLQTGFLAADNAYGIDTPDGFCTWAS